jgi:hypothetical protein
MNAHNVAGEIPSARRYRTIRSLSRRIVGAIASVVLHASRSLAQGCAMCYQNAAASGSQGRTTLQQGILILLLPALTVFVGIVLLIYRRSNVAR